ncbi:MULTISPECIES: YihY/virulence factor BrkB family protein [unclassified Streptomyces]|uniref:YihY/virulence factor BrkB family protein n=1 Tax=unclassified Streptomyces TaxID=2593676 RepID=UPI002481D5EE|nr:MULTISPECIES: YihY/virulence factor BrkB family protein [unclassified Streptomyces]MDA5284043.1 YihY/virulence factor BrkB family protein [Streptomyces sp. Isolate_45]MDX2389118.1 YihY/virulence factor BrkB family protein [Streptomyces sp. DK15]
MTEIPRTAPRPVGRPTVALAARTRAELRRTAVRVWNDNLADHAAALTYYAVLALLPALAIAVSLVGLSGGATTERLITELTSYAPPQSAQVLRDALGGLLAERSSMVALLISGVVSSLWSACSYLAVFRRALHTMHGVPETRPPLRAAHMLVVNAMSLLVLLVAGAVGLVVSGPVGRWVVRATGGDSPHVIALLRWPVLLAVVTFLVLILFRTGPAQSRGTRRGLPGGVLAALLWLAASGLFTLYTELGTYGRLYGSLAGIVVFLVWLWFANLALLTGAQFNVERARRPAARPRAS